jgi:hypothetical protein
MLPAKRTKAPKRSTGAELRDGDGPFTSCDLVLLPEPDRDAGDPRPVIEFLPKDDRDGWAVRLTLAEAADLVSGLTAFILAHGRTA